MLKFTRFRKKPRRSPVRRSVAPPAKWLEAGELSSGVGRADIRCCASVIRWAVTLTVIGRLVGTCPAFAGGGPENVIVVVNAASWASLAVANEYVHLRHIPADNIFYLDWEGGFETTDIATFRQQILGPVVVNLEQRGLEEQIDYIVYSSDFPTAITAKYDAQNMQLPNELYPTGSINSLTYLWQNVIAKSPATISLANNHYMRISAEGTAALPVHGFRSWYGWGPNGQLLEAGG